MGMLFIAVLIGLIPAIVASGKGHSFVLWWLYGAALFIIAFPHSLLLKRNVEAIEQSQMDDGMKKCQRCAEMVKRDARVCRYCQGAFE